MKKKTRNTIIAVVGIGIAIFGIAFAYGTMQDIEETEEALSGTEESTTEVNAMKQAASQCASYLASEGKETGTPNESICGNICSEYKENDFQVTDEAKNNGIENPYQACIAGKPEWIK